MKMTNVEIAREIEARGYDFYRALEAVDEARTPEQEAEETNEHDVLVMIKDICLGFDCEDEFRTGEMF